MADVSFHQTLSQQQTLAPQMRQSLEILQASSLELQQLLRQALDINPVLEDEINSLSLEEFENEDPEPALPSESDADDYRELAIMENRAISSSQDDIERRENLYNSIVAPESLQQHLTAQLDLALLSPPHRKAADALMGNMDERGFFDQSLPELGGDLALPLDDLLTAKSVLQSFEPPGIACDDLHESLLLQLERTGHAHSLEHQIVDEHLEELARKRYPQIAKILGCTVEEVAQAAERISGLDPSPGTSFDPSSNPYISPDVSFELDAQGSWIAVLTNEYLPKLRISDQYKDLLANSADRKLRSYLRDQLREGRTVMKALDLRQGTILAISEQILLRQQDFLKKGPRYLKPLTMNEIAEIIGVHPTTVSRAVAGKYVRTPHGIMEMRRFFASGYTSAGGTEVSNAGVREAIQEIVAGEPPKKPLSDAAIKKVLEAQGLKVARRTVAKYREQLNILPSHLRKSYQ
jgi:RNA polymerase sigma-54 factor